MKTAEAHNAELTEYYRGPVQPMETPAINIVSDGLLRMKRLRSFAATKPVRSKRWKKWITGHPCKCGAPADHPHHIFGSYGSLKTSDLFCVPRCADCHEREKDLDEDILEEYVRLVHEYLRGEFDEGK